MNSLLTNKILLRAILFFSLTFPFGESVALQPETVDADLDDVIFAAFDTETTGLSPTRDRVIELAVVRYQAGKILDQKTWLFDPGMPIPFYATRAHGITDDMVKGQPSFADIVSEFEEYIGDSVLIAHNARFDINFVNDEYDRISRTRLKNEVIDSLRLFRSWYPGINSYTLSSVAKHANIEGDVFHRALADSIYVARLLDLGIQNVKPQSLSEVYRQSGGPMSF